MTITDINKLTNMSHVVLLHGLGEKPQSLKPLEWYLHYSSGFNYIKTIHYPSNTLNLNDCIDNVAGQIVEWLSDDFDINVTLINQEEEEEEDEESLNADTGDYNLIIIGQSMGGVVGSLLHRTGLNIVDLVTIGSPLRGAWLVKFLKKARLPTNPGSHVQAKL